MGRPVGRKVRDAEEARKLLQQWSGSGEALPTWCARERINWYSLVAYQRWPNRGLQPKGQDFVEVATAALVRSTVPPAVRSGRYRVVVGDFAVEVEPDFDDVVLQRILRAVAVC